MVWGKFGAGSMGEIFQKKYFHGGQKYLGKKKLWEDYSIWEN